MIETQLKTLIKSIDLTNEILTTILNTHAVGGQDVEPGKELPQPASPTEQVPPTQQAPVPGGTTPANNSPVPDPAEPVAGGTTPAPVKASPRIPQTQNEAETVAALNASISLQERIMVVSQATSNPMLGMQFLAQAKLSSFTEMSTEQIANVDKQLAEITAAAGVVSL